MTFAEHLDQATAMFHRRAGRGAHHRAFGVQRGRAARNSRKRKGPMMLQGKRAIVLGGSSGIGLAATNQLASEGVSVVAASRHPQRAQQSVRAGVELQVCDVQDREALRALFAASAPFDILEAVWKQSL